MEALALGRTCVVAAIPGIEQLIKDGETGYLFSSGNGNSLAAVVAAIIRENKYLSPERLERFMFEHFDVDQCCERMLRWVQSVVVGTTENSTTDTKLVIRDT
jgi:glycosyltransferase involved in cell wall biosynthesis